MPKLRDWVKQIPSWGKYIILGAIAVLLIFLVLEVRACRKATSGNEVEYWKGVASERAIQAGEAEANLSIIKAQLAADREAYDEAVSEKNGEITSLYGVLSKTTEEKDRAVVEKKKALAEAKTDSERVRIQATIIIDLEARISSNEKTYAEIIKAKDEVLEVAKVRIHNLEIGHAQKDAAIKDIISERDALKKLTVVQARQIKWTKTVSTIEKGMLVAAAGYILLKK